MTTGPKHPPPPRLLDLPLTQQTLSPAPSNPSLTSALQLADLELITETSPAVSLAAPATAIDEVFLPPTSSSITPSTRTPPPTRPLPCLRASAPLSAPLLSILSPTTTPPRRLNSTRLGRRGRILDTSALGCRTGTRIRTIRVGLSKTSSGLLVRLTSEGRLASRRDGAGRWPVRTLGA
jgi:hypothetical protein